MLQLNHQYANLDLTKLKPEIDKLQEYVQYLNTLKQSPEYDHIEDFIFLPDNKLNLAELKEKVSEAREHDYDLIILVGIGGSNLGAWTIYHALRPDKQIIFAETIDPELLADQVAQLQAAYSQGKRALLLVISKSGSTTESLANFTVFYNEFKKVEPDWQQRIYAITEYDSKLEKLALTNNFNILNVPKLLVGRCSVFSYNGLFPLALAGIDIGKLLSGAKMMNALSLKTVDENNPSLISTLAIYTGWQQGLTISNTFIFSAKLSVFGNWYRQLVGESIGKDGTGITPIISMGTTDLHSVTQLYLAGLKDKFTTFLGVDNFRADQSLVSELAIDEIIPGLSGKTIAEIMHIVETAVKTTYSNLGLPHLRLTLPIIDEENLGALLQFKMLETVFFAKLLNINAFDQPAVELYKQEIRKLM